MMSTSAKADVCPVSQAARWVTGHPADVLEMSNVQEMMCVSLIISGLVEQQADFLEFL